jgi:hypothetical protein
MSLNSVLGIFTACYIRPGDLTLAGILVVTLLWSLATWHRLERLSSKFKDQALKTLRGE